MEVSLWLLTLIKRLGYLSEKLEDKLQDAGFKSFTEVAGSEISRG
jgi:hypothetical protein